MPNEPHERLAAARERAGFQTASDAARAFGWNENTYRSHENGERGIRPEVASKYAFAFKTSAAYILIGETYNEKLQLTEMSLTGYIDAGGSASPRETYPERGEGRQIIYLAATFVDDPYAFEVMSDDVLGFLSVGDLVVVAKRPCIPQEFVNRLCFVDIGNSRGYITYLRFGSQPETINLETSVRRPEDLRRMKTVYPVQAVFFKGQWGRAPLSLWKLPRDNEN